MENEILTVKKAADILEANERFIRDAISNVELKAYRRGSRTYILKTDLVEFIKTGEDAKEAGKKNVKRKDDTEG